MIKEWKFSISDQDLLNLDDVYLTGNVEVRSRSVFDLWLNLDELLEDLRLQYSIPDLQSMI